MSGGLGMLEPGQESESGGIVQGEFDRLVAPLRQEADVTVRGHWLLIGDDFAYNLHALVSVVTDDVSDRALLVPYEGSTVAAPVGVSASRIITAVLGFDELDEG